MQTVGLLHPGTDGIYAETEPKEGRFESRVMPGFYLRAEWLWQSPLPDEMQLLLDMLAP